MMLLKGPWKNPFDYGSKKYGDLYKKNQNFFSHCRELEIQLANGEADMEI